MHKLKDFLFDRFVHFLWNWFSQDKDSNFAQLKSRRIPSLPCQTSAYETQKGSEQMFDSLGYYIGCLASVQVDPELSQNERHRQ